MRVGLNATCFSARPSGANQRFAGIYGALIRNHPEIEFVIYEPRDCRVAEWFAGAPNLVARQTPLPSVGRAGRMWHGAGYWRRTLREDRLDLFECFNLPLVRAPDCPTLLTIHDIRSTLPGEPMAWRMLALFVHRWALEQAETVITVSNAMRADLLALVPGATVVSVYNGLDRAQFTDPEAPRREQTRARLGLPAEFVLTVGHLEPRKNQISLVEAVALLRDQGRPMPLVIVGNDAGDRVRIDEAVARLGLGELVRVLTSIDNATLLDLYHLSRVVVFPSRYEGFGIPVLEAMATRRPLITSDIAVFRELTEDKGLYFPPEDSQAAAALMLEVADSPELVARLVSYGDARIADFAFDTLAEEVLAVYRGVSRRP